ncbi:MAG: helix-turn-helix domain-containing protein [Limimaricola sp.]|uniref:DUF6456 domain-containing protein n=1 Tax=Limimaricola sp. TaxID=2211665 RepID=UPI001E016494|nr:DUF6456 domain-containing protein [Limimaricola sp.]MBI1418129.1 helix-turn-helix domain-containing protein [Limimaricola sp.]
MTGTRGPGAELALPAWVPQAARNYIVHTETGMSIRALARASEVHASTILRQVRRFENRRDDPLIDEALRNLAACLAREGLPRKEMTTMTKDNAQGPGEARIASEGARVLRRLAEPGAVLAVARDMEQAVVVREGPGGAATRTAVVACDIAQAMALRDWIACGTTPSRIARYTITPTGRAELRRMMIAEAGRGLAEAPASFAAAPGIHADKRSHEAESWVDPVSRFSGTDSPLIALARRKDRDGKPFLTRDQVAAGERLREDFELAQMGPKVTQNWDRFLTAPASGPQLGPLAGGGASAAAARLRAALAELGPGLGDVALRCCCYLEGLEQAEERLGWAARSGKIVLRIALTRLQRHYEAQGEAGKMMG